MLLLCLSFPTSTYLTKVTQKKSETDPPRSAHTHEILWINIWELCWRLNFLNLAPVLVETFPRLIPDFCCENFVRLLIIHKPQIAFRAEACCFACCSWLFYEWRDSSMKSEDTLRRLTIWPLLPFWVAQQGAVHATDASRLVHDEMLIQSDERKNISQHPLKAPPTVCVVGKPQQPSSEAPCEAYRFLMKAALELCWWHEKRVRSSYELNSLPCRWDTGALAFLIMWRLLLKAHSFF